MGAILIKPGVALGIGGGKIGLWSPLRTSTGGGTSGGSTTPSSITGIQGYWDASTAANMLAASGSPVAGWNLSVSSIADTSGNSRPLAVYSKASSPTPPVSTPRLNGLLAGVGRNTVIPPGSLPASGQYLPVMDPDQGFQLAGVTFGTSADWSVYLVWSRPNLRQAGNGSTAPVALVTIGSVPVVTLGNTNLVLLPTGANVTMSASMERRHSHWLLLSYSHTAGMTAILDGTQVASGVSAGAIGSGGALTCLHDTTVGGGAQCWFHEAAYWSRALSGTDLTTLATAASRWKTGARRGISIAVIGQSNAVNGLAWGSWHTLAMGVGWYLGALGWNVAGALGSTVIGAQGLYPVPSGDPGGGLPGSFLVNPGDGSSPSGWSLDTASGAQGGLIQSYFAGLSAADLSDVAAIWWPWNETDSTRAYSEKATLLAAEERAVGLLRGFIGKSAAALPWVVWSGMPFPYGPNDPGECAIREIFAAMAGVSGGNYQVGCLQTCDVGPNGTDYSHISPTSSLLIGMRASVGVAKAILASSGGDGITAFPAGVTANGGPTITHVQQVTAQTYKLTITHDGGTDLVLNGEATAGVGFSIMDGGSTSTTPGVIINASGCSRVDATHILITLPTAPTHPASQLTLFYPYGAAFAPGPATDGQHSGSGIGSANAVTDNTSTVTPPTGWDIGNQLGSAWAMNWPLATPLTGLQVTTSPG